MARKSKAPEIVEGIRIERMAAEGRCVGHLEDGRVLFVPYSAPGDIADITLGRRRTVSYTHLDVYKRQDR